MSHIVFNLFRRSRSVLLVREVKLAPCPSLPLLVTNKLIAKGLLLALLGTLGMPGNAQPSRVPVVAQVQDASQTNAIAKQLLGRWQAKDPRSDQVVTFIFAPVGNLFIVLPPRDGSSVALKVAYQINPTTQPKQLDIQLSPEQKALTIFELTADGKLRLELEGLAPGKPRPTGFQANATLFEKASESTTVPENIQVIEFQAFEDSNNQRVQKPQDEAKNYMYALTQVQQAHYREQGQFATAIEEVSIGLRTETESYRYRIVPQGDNTQSVMIAAQAKKSDLPSYTGAVFATNMNGETTPVSQICETDKPSTSPPAMPVAPAGGSSKIQCPAGSRPLL